MWLMLNQKDLLRGQKIITEPILLSTKEEETL